MTTERLFRTTVVIWTEYDPGETELVDLAREATDGDGYCQSQRTEEITDPKAFPETEFFDTEDED